VFHSLGVYVHPRFWNPRKREVRKGHPHADKINGLIARRVAEAEDERLRLLTEREPVTAYALRAAVLPEAEEEARCFLVYVQGRLDALERAGKVDRHRNDRAVFRKLAAFVAGSREPAVDLDGVRLPFDRIDLAFLRDFHARLTSPTVGNNAATANKNLKRFGTYLRAAKADGAAPTRLDPFSGFRPAQEAEVDRARLTLDELAALAALDLPVDSFKAAVRDGFLFSVFVAGPRVSDLFRLRCGDVTAETDEAGGRRLRLTYGAGKTGKRFSARLNPTAARIAARYRAGEDGEPRPAEAWLFPFLDGYDVSTPEAWRHARGTRTAYYNKTLRQLASDAGIQKRLSSHVARHSFADLTRRENWNLFDTSKALRHGSLAVTQRYLAKSDDEKLDRLLDSLPSLGAERIDNRARAHFQQADG